MSLVWLKNLVFGRQSTASGETERLLRDQNKSYGGRRSASADTLFDEPDLESQTTRTFSSDSRAAESRSFKIDPRIISDATIGLSDGLTVPFALTAGLSALQSTRVVIYGGLAELIAGAISMGLGGYLGAKSELASYRELCNETTRTVENDPAVALDDVKSVFAPYNVPSPVLDELVGHLSKSPRLVDFLLQFRHCATEPASNRALTSAVTIALGYFLGGLIPLIPYVAVGEGNLYLGLYISVAVMAVALFTFGYVKTCVVSGWRGSGNVLQGVLGGMLMVVTGGLAAAAAMGLVRFFDHLAS